jgi:hypothetical protein
MNNKTRKPMKTNLYFIIIFLTVFISCTKERQTPPLGKSEIIKEAEGKFMKEVMISDESGKNSAYYRIYSDSKEILEKYLESYSLILKTAIDLPIDLTSNKGTEQTLKSTDIKNFDLQSDPSVIIELVTVNLEKNIKNYYLEVQKKKLKSTADFIWGYPVSYTTTGDFIGVVHYEEGYEIAVKMNYKECWLCSWKDVYINGGNGFWVGRYIGSYWLRFATGSYYKRGLTIYPHLYQVSTNYYIAYSADDFRGNVCSIGSWDTRNCYVGTAPTGTTAFVYPNNTGNFYYSPVNGNQCPLPGSSFDGGNCYVTAIPNSTWGFIWNNSWYVKSDKIQ